MNNWYWFGILIDKAEHLRMRQVHVRSDVSINWTVEVWSKGESGKLWRIEVLKSRIPHQEAIAKAKEYMAEYCTAYYTVDEGEPYYADDQEPAASPAGGASPEFWADVLQVDPNASNAEIKSAFRKRAMETHPDQGGDAEDFKKVYAAYEYAKNERGI
jgi:hypothetical protein